MEPKFVKIRGTDSVLLIADRKSHKITCLQVTDGSRRATREDVFDINEAAKVPLDIINSIIEYVERDNRRFEKRKLGVSYAVSRLKLCDSGDVMAVVRVVEWDPVNSLDTRKAGLPPRDQLAPLNANMGTSKKLQHKKVLRD
ncbi:hypothetical protein TWF718_000669 [Orbilia javanica]|uniref:Uncharacterized protein n=1 Tax=Orbilia javanica TaxID=47235 RepID=A0AAN8MU98_9PEZI